MSWRRIAHILGAVFWLRRRVAELEQRVAEHRLLTLGELADLRCELEDARAQVDELYVVGGTADRR